MARLKTSKSIDMRIAETEEKLRKLKERCDKTSEELDVLYLEKRKSKTKNFLKQSRTAQELEQNFSLSWNRNKNIDYIQADTLVILGHQNIR